ncbi:MAG: FtsW/RodA/SpoVE family cell cycle protein [Oscillospiraceae bacterium]|nr:FtsW/RodA/SpoVE family cell cycle protein [Oscillospiraceae bacterium]
MVFGETLQTILSVALFVLRIFIPCISIGVLVGCFISHRRGRRRDEPVVYLEDIASGLHIPVLYWENSIGRSKSCDITLPDSTVSRDHAVLMRRESGWFIADTQSKGGTYVNGKRVDKEAMVRPGDVISMGTAHLSLKRVNDVETPDELFSDSHRKAALRAQRRKMKPAPNPAKLLWGVTIIQILLAVQCCVGTGKLVLEPLISLFALIILSWGLYLFSRKALGRVSFEIETIGLLLSSIGVMLLTGEELKPNYTQLIGLFLGILFFCFLIWFMGDLERVMKFRLYIAIAAVLFFGINLIFGSASYGARNWIHLGPVSIQPSEFIKIAFIFTGASTLNKLQTTRNLSGFLIFSALCLGALFLMKDFGTACIFFITFLIIAFMRSGNIRTIILIIAGAAFGVFLILQFMPYIANRFAAWRHVWEYADAAGWQQTSAMMYSASGGLFGLGLGNGYMKTIFAGDSDIVFGMICEELGLVMGVIVLLALALLILLARSDVTRSRSTFYSICGCAASGLLLFQACLNVFGTVDILPLTGVTLPFISLGGSSMMAVWGLLSFCKAADERTYAVRKRRKAAPVENIYSNSADDPRTQFERARRPEGGNAQ